DQYQTKLLTALQSGKDLPDIFDLERGYIGKFIDSKFLADLSAMGGEDLVKDYVPYVQGLGRSSDGKLKAISDHSSPGGFW
ncbi:extracellular solute-binding protein, partial [Marinobacter sp. 71-i]